METSKVFMFVLFSLSYVITNNIPAKNRDFSLLFPPTFLIINFAIFEYLAGNCP